MDIIKIFEKIRKYNAENNAVRTLDPIKTKTFTETINIAESNVQITPVEQATTEFINGSSIESHRNYGESIRGLSQPLIFFNDEPIERIFSVDDFIRDDELE